MDNLDARLEYAISLYRSGVSINDLPDKTGLSRGFIEKNMTEDDRLEHKINKKGNDKEYSLDYKFCNEWDKVRLGLLKACGKV